MLNEDLLVRPVRAVTPCVVAFVLVGRAVVEPGVAPLAVVPGLDPVEDRRPRLLPGPERTLAKQLLLKRGVAAGRQAALDNDLQPDLPPLRSRRRRHRPQTGDPHTLQHAWGAKTRSGEARALLGRR